MNNKFKKGIEEIKNLRMTPAEKQGVFERILAEPAPHIMPHVSRSVPSPFMVFFRSHRFSSVVLASLIFVVFSGTGIVLASGKSLPGGTLYPIKIRVAEPLREVFAATPEALVELQLEKASRRMEEAQILAGQNKLDDKAEQQIKNLLEKHTEKFIGTIGKISENTKAQELPIEFQARMDAHARVLELMSNRTDVVLAARANAEKVKKERRDTKDEANTVGEVIKPSPAYTEKKKSVKTIIDTTTSHLNNVSGNAETTAPSSLLKKKLIDTTATNLEKAEKQLREADDRNNAGEQSEAYSSLIDSEKTAKEASIILEAGLKADARLDLEKKKESVKSRATNLFE